MAKYLFTYHGGRMPETEEEGAAVIARWGAWMGSLGAALVDQGTRSASGDDRVGWHHDPRWRRDRDWLQHCRGRFGTRTRWGWRPTARSARTVAPFRSPRSIRCDRDDRSGRPADVRPVSPSPRRTGTRQFPPRRSSLRLNPRGGAVADRTATQWGVYDVETRAGRIDSVTPIPSDADPSRSGMRYSMGSSIVSGSTVRPFAKVGSRAARIVGGIVVAVSRLSRSLGSRRSIWRQVSLAGSSPSTATLPSTEARTDGRAPDAFITLSPSCTASSTASAVAPGRSTPTARRQRRPYCPMSCRRGRRWNWSRRPGTRSPRVATGGELRWAAAPQQPGLLWGDHPA